VGVGITSMSRLSRMVTWDDEMIKHYIIVKASISSVYAHRVISGKTFIPMILIIELSITI